MSVSLPTEEILRDTNFPTFMPSARELLVFFCLAPLS
jgi:hypothetical protein